MQRALALAQRGEGQTSPNPPVGAVIVRAGKLLGQGWHRRAGTPHAEVLAIRSAGTRARGSTLYVTLEPCCTSGRTPPCTQAIIKAGIRQVVFATRDPNPRHNGRGASILRRAGLKVIEGICAPQARQLIAPFARWITTQRPYLTLKLAVSLDGKIADCRRESRWITSATSRRAVQALRRKADAILVGAGTIIADDPALGPKPARGHRPWRVVVTGRGTIPANAQVLTDQYRSKTIIATTRRGATRRQATWLAKGVRVWVLPEAKGTVALVSLLKKLGRLGCLRVLCEGGGELAASLIRARLVDECQFFIAPKILGGRKAIPAVGGTGWPLEQAPKLSFTECRRIGEDLLITAKPKQRN